MDYMFYNCTSLNNINISNFNLENLRYSTHMFSGCLNISVIEFKDNTLTKNLEDMSYMFYYCISLENINI